MQIILCQAPSAYFLQLTAAKGARFIAAAKMLLKPVMESPSFAPRDPLAQSTTSFRGYTKNKAKPFHSPGFSIRSSHALKVINRFWLPGFSTDG